MIPGRKAFILITRLGGGEYTQSRGVSGGVPSALLPGAGDTPFPDVGHLSKAGSFTEGSRLFQGCLLAESSIRENFLTVRCGPLSSSVLLSLNCFMVHPSFNLPLFLGISLSAENGMTALTFAGFPRHRELQKTAMLF